jgi:2Fe-2S ferredoxin
MAKIIFLGGPDGRVEVEAKSGDTLLDIAEHHGIKMGSACGGVCACSSCHCWIRSGAQSLEEASAAEEDRLDQAFDVRNESRLGCQVRVGDADLTVELTQESIQTWYNEHPDQRPK